MEKTTIQLIVEHMTNIGLLNLYKHYISFEEWDKAIIVQEEIYSRMVEDEKLNH
jgi:hypothetical protein